MVDGKNIGVIGIFVLIVGSTLFFLWVIAFFVSVFILIKGVWTALNQLVVPDDAQELEERIYTPNVRVDTHTEPE